MEIRRNTGSQGWSTDKLAITTLMIKLKAVGMNAESIVGKKLWSSGAFFIC